MRQSTKNPEFIIRDTDARGNVRVYFRRRRDEKKTRIEESFGSPEFWARYRELVALTECGALAVTEEAGVMPPLAVEYGTLKWLCCKYFASRAFKGLAQRTQRVRKLVLDGCLAEQLSRTDRRLFGQMPVSKFGIEALETLRDRKKDRPEAANNRLRAFGPLLAWAVSEKIILSAPPRAKFLRPANPDGHHCWTAAERARFEAHFPIGTKARLAYALLYYTGARRSDVVRLGRQNERQGGSELFFRPVKTEKITGVSVTIPIEPELRDAINAGPTGDLTYIVSEDGTPYTADSFGNWFRDCCREAGVSKAGERGCSPHGLRKALATKCAEGEATTRGLMATFGWKTPKEAMRYTEAADRRQLAANTMLCIRRVGAVGGKRRV